MMHFDQFVLGSYGATHNADGGHDVTRGCHKKEILFDYIQNELRRSCVTVTPNINILIA